MVKVVIGHVLAEVDDDNSEECQEKVPKVKDALVPGNRRAH